MLNTASQTPRNPTILAWKPEPELEPRLVNPNLRARPVLGAIEVAKGQKLDREIYLALLSDRLDQMLSRTPDPVQALANLYEMLDEAGLAPDQRPTLAEAGNALIYSNPAMVDHLDALNIPGHLPKRATQDDAAAKRLIKETSLETWASLLLETPVDPDR